MRRRLGDTLLDQGLLTEEELATALEEQLRTGERLGRTLVRLALLSESEVADALSKHLGIKRVDFSELYLSAEVVDLVPAAFIMTKRVLPIEVENGSLLVAMVDPLDITVIDDLQRLTGDGPAPGSNGRRDH